MTDHTYAGHTLAEIKAAAEAAPNWDWDSNQTPFYNDPDGFSRGGNCDGTYSVFGEPFEIEGEQYDGKVLVERCWKDEATFICEAKPAILAMAARIEELEKRAAEFARLVSFLRDDSAAISYQSLGQYRSEALRLAISGTDAAMEQTKNREGA